jgi:hypothetical protein
MSAPRSGVGAAGKPSRGKPCGLIAVVAMVFIPGAGPAWPSGIATGASKNREVYNARRRVDPYPPRTCATCGQEFTPVRLASGIAAAGVVSTTIRRGLTATPVRRWSDRTMRVAISAFLPRGARRYPAPDANGLKALPETVCEGV